MENRKFHSGIYEGMVMHHRLHPVAHIFRYKVCMVYLDLQELDAVFDLSPFWSCRRWNFARFRREDFLGEKDMPLHEAVRATVKKATGIMHVGPIRMLTNLRYFGYIINPITCYYCFDTNEKLKFLVAEVTNTPWGERHAYVMTADGNVVNQDFSKQMHVSPFLPMNMQYSFRASLPGQSLSIAMENRKEDELVFRAALGLHRREMSGSAMSRLLLRFPLMTVKVAAGIYWEALRLKLKGVPFLAHPRHQPEKVRKISGLENVQE